MSFCFFAYLYVLTMLVPVMFLQCCYCLLFFVLSCIVLVWGKFSNNFFLVLKAWITPEKIWGAIWTAKDWACEKQVFPYLITPMIIVLMNVVTALPPKCPRTPFSFLILHPVHFIIPLTPTHPTLLLLGILKSLLLCLLTFGTLYFLSFYHKRWMRSSIYL